MMIGNSAESAIMEYAFYFLVATAVAGCFLYLRRKLRKRRNNVRHPVRENRPVGGYASDLPNCVLQPNSTTGVRPDTKERT